jgi:hypothetical protein
VELTIHRTEHRRGIVAHEGSRGAHGRLDIGYHERRGEAFAGGVCNSESQLILGKRQKVEAVNAKRAELPAASRVTDTGGGRYGVMHKALLDVAGGSPVLTYVDHHCVGHFLRTSI